MTHQHYGNSHTTLKAIARKAAVKSGKSRRFQVDLEPKGVLSGRLQGDRPHAVSSRRYADRNNQFEFAHGIISYLTDAP